MTGKRDKIRGVFLTALMVLSVFAGTIAFSGGAAAQVPDTDQDPVEFEFPSNDTNHIEVVFEEDVTATNFNYTVTDRNGDEVNVSVNALSSGPRVVLNVDEDLTGDAELEVDDGTDSETFDITTTSKSIEPGETTSQQAFKGERVAIVNGTANTPYSIKEGGEFPFLDRTTGADSLVGVVRTGNINELQTGNTYYVTFENGANVSLGVRSLGLSVEREDSSVTFRSGGSATIEATATSNVANRNVEFRLKRGGSYVKDNRIDDGDNNRTVNLDGEGEATIEFDVSREGNYTVEVVDVQSDISDETQSIRVSKVSGDASFAQSVVSEERGDVARITINMRNRDEVSLNIGSEDLNYLTEVTVEDGNDDGRVVVLFNTFAPSASGSFVANDDDDDVEVNQTVIPVGSPLATAAYDMNLTTGGVRAADSGQIDELAVGTLSVRDRATTGLRTWTAASGADLDERDRFAGYVEAGNLTRDSTIAQNDLVVLEVQASGIFGAINATNSGNATDAVVQLNNNGAINFSVYESDATIAPNADGAQILDPNQLDHNVVPDPQNNVLYVVIPSNAVLNKPNAQVDDRFVANFTVPKRTDLAKSRQTVTSEFRIVERELMFDTNAELDDGTEIIEVRADDNQTISGRTSLAPGSEVSITARATGDAPFLLDQDATVQPDGTFNASFDFSNVSAGQNFTVDASGNFEDDPETDGRVRAAATASVTFNDQSSNGEQVRVASATLSDGGFVTIHDSSLQDGDALGSVVGTSNYLQEGSSSGITVMLDSPITSTQTLIAMPHQDTNGNQQYDFVSSEGSEDGPYTSGGQAVTDSARVTVEEATPTPTQTAEPTPTQTAEPTPTQTAEPTPTQTEPSTPEPTEGDGAGFGVIVALIALIGAALLAARRNA